MVRRFWGGVWVSWMVLGMMGSLGSGKEDNKEAYDLLCRMTQTTTSLLNAKSLSHTVQSALEKAVFGANTSARLREDGDPSLLWRCARDKGRHKPCTYDTRNQTHGSKCLAENLIGTFLCVCTPGANGTTRDLCGENWPTGRQHQWYGGTQGPTETSLLRHVWDKVIQKCRKGGAKDIAENVKDLEDSVNQVTDLIRKGKGNNSNIGNLQGANGTFYFLGHTGKNGCGAHHTGDSGICASYQAKNGGDSEPHIPWVDRIQELLPQLKEHVARLNTEKARKKAAEALEEARRKAAMGEGHSGHPTGPVLEPAPVAHPSDGSTLLNPPLWLLMDVCLN